MESLRATNHKGIELLTARERQVIQHVAGGLSNREIAHALELSPHTVKNYLFRIFDKLGVSSRTELLYLTRTTRNPSPHSPLTERGSHSLRLSQPPRPGDPCAQLRLAEHFSQIKDVQDNEHGQIVGLQPASVSAYMWYLLAEKTATPMLGQIEAGKSNIRQTMFPQQLAEAEVRAAAWLRNAKKRSGFADGREAKAHDAPSKRIAAR